MKQNNETLEQLGAEYFSMFSNKDLNAIGEQFAEDITLIDWENMAQGKNNVLEINRKIFIAVNSIHVEVEKTYSNNLTLIAELRISVDGHILKVVDILEFNSELKIKSIRAYRCF